MLGARGKYGFLVALALVCGALGCGKARLYEPCSSSRSSPCEKGLVCVPANPGTCSAATRGGDANCPGTCLVPCEDASQCSGGAACREHRNGSLKFCAPGTEAIP
jgi:hypothetical protein